jgi:putative glutathione S-transferase
MGHLLEGAWTDQDVLTENKNGLYVKNPSVFRNRITADGSSGFPAEAGRYHLYAAVSCPWAHRTVLYRVLKKLEDIVTLANVAQTVGGQGWTFENDHLVSGTDRRVKYLHELYTISDPTCTSRVTVPTLWDARTCKVVNNESSEIIRMFNTEFAAFTPATPDYYPPHLREEIDAMNALVLKGVNDAVNGCGRSFTQEAYAQSFKLLFDTLDALEARLGKQRYLCGNTQTEADWRLFPNLIRFDPVSYIGYKCNLRRIEDYPNLSNYLRDLYQTPGIAAVCDIEGMKEGVFGPAGPIKGNGIVPLGPFIDHNRPHDRARFSAMAAE